MKIAIIAPEVFPVPPIRGGAVETYIEEVSARLAEHEVSIFSIADPDLPLVEVKCPREAEDRERKTEDRRQPAEGGEQNTAGGRRQGSGSGVVNQKPETRHSKLSCGCASLMGHRVYHRWQRGGFDRVLLASWKLPFKQSRSRWYYWPYSRWVAKHLARLQPEVVWIHSRMPFVPWIRRALPKARLVLSIHNLSNLEGRSAWSQEAIGSCDVFAGVSDFIRSAIEKKHPSCIGKTRVLYNSVNPDHFVPHWARGEERAKLRAAHGLEGPTILFVGRLVEPKGAHVLIEAFKRALESKTNEELEKARQSAESPEPPDDKKGDVSIFPNVPGTSPFSLGSDDRENRNVPSFEEASLFFPKPETRNPKPNPASLTLLIVGSHTFSDERATPYIEQLRALSGDDSRIQFIGYVPRGDIRNYYLMSDVVAFPSVWSEPFGTVVLEAMASGLPVIAFDKGGTVEAIRHGHDGWLVAGEQGVRGFADGLERLLADAALRERLGQEARRTIEARFNWAATAEAFLALCGEAAEAQGREENAAGRGQKAEGSRQKAESRTQPAVGREQEVGGRVRSSEWRTRNQKPETKNSKRTHAHAVLIAESGSGFGGSAKYLSELVAQLDPGRYAVEVAAAEEGPFIRKVREQGIRVTLQPGWRFQADRRRSGGVTERLGEKKGDVSIIPSSTGRKIETSPFLKLARYGLVAAVQLAVGVPGIAAWLMCRRIRLVHLNNEILSHLPLLISARLCGCRVICHLHGWRPLTRIERWASGWVDEFVCISEAGARYYRSQLPKRSVTAIPNGLCLNGDVSIIPSSTGRKIETSPAVRQAMRARLGFGTKDVVSALIGRLVPWKGQAVYLRALAKARERHPHLLGLVVGNDPRADQRYLKELRELSRRLGIEECVRFLSWQEDVGSLYAAADFFVHASVAPEPFGLVILEAMAKGLPVIATEAGGVVDVVRSEETGLLVKPDDVEALAGAMIRLIDEPRLAARLARSGQEAARTVFTMERNAAQVAGVYDRLLSGARMIER